MINIDKKDSLVSIKIIEPKGERQLKYMATVKEYYDELNGNSYWSCRVEDTEEDINYIFPFQYGYGTQSEYTVKEALRIKEVFGDNPVIKFIKIIIPIIFIYLIFTPKFRYSKYSIRYSIWSY